MKKIIIAFAAIATLTFVSCGNKTTQTTTTADTTVVDSVANAVDSVAVAAVDSVAK